MECTIKEFNITTGEERTIMTIICSVAQTQKIIKAIKKPNCLYWVEHKPMGNN